MLQIRTVTGAYESRSFTANPSQQWGTTSPLPNGMLSMSASGQSVSTESSLQLAAVYGSTAIIADSIATLPIRQWRLQKSGEPKAVESSDVIAQPWAPWPEYTMMDFVVQGTMSYLLRGNVFGKILAFDGMMKPAQVELVNPDHVNVMRDPVSKAIEVRYYGQRQPADEVTRSMGRSVAGAIAGMSPISYMRNVLGVALAQDRAAGAFFANSARPDGVIELPGEFDVNEVQAFKESWLQAHQGTNHAYMLGVLTGGAKYTPVSVSMADAQFLQQMQYSASVISGMIYRVPPHMIGMVDKDTSWGSGIEQQELGFVRNTLLFWLTRWEDWLTSWLPPREFVTFDLSKRLRGDTLQRFSAYQIARVCGFMNNLDIMRVEGMTLPTDPAQLASLSAYDQPLNSAPVKAPSSSGVGPAGDGAN